MSVLFAVPLVLLFVLPAAYSSDPVVDLPMGRIRGMRNTVIGKELEVFLGIPYAKPPLRNLRYKKPVSIESYKDDIVAKTLPKTCFQVNPFEKDGAEYYKKKKNTEPKSVLVWIYGGGFTMGSTADPRYNGQVIAAHGQVIVASINYRVGAMGFLNGVNKEEPGNLGLYDQTMALRWIRNNIAYFGGNPEKVTIFGESAGGFSVGFHLTSPFSKGLFKSGILQSGVANSPPYYYNQKDSEQTTKDFITRANCTGPSADFRKDIVQILKCLRSKTPEELSKAEYQVTPFVIPKNIHTQDFIVGMTTEEGSGFTHDFFHDFSESNNVTKSEAYSLLVPFLKNVGKVHEPTEKVNYYFRQVLENDVSSVKRAVADLLTDWMFRCPSYEFSEVLAKRQSQVYFYLFNHVPESIQNDPDRRWMGSRHFSDVQYVFGHPFLQDVLEYKTNYTKAEKKFSLK
ncbi:BCHE [Cordylochernes scorpioides]|uniref:Carboxylic ester hydrolase n=1 Tax=Cordylochernes scorpioides TaxID=51811 RepID=A0ABY6KH50_9ARAC|nr:BCHE [Cordylochernes scorpioides]